MIFLKAITIFFFLVYPAKTDDIRDYQIEGIGIGDSVLDFMSLDEIKETIKLTENNYNYLKNPKKYREAYIFEPNNFKNYEKLSLMFRQNDKNYKILFVRGLIDYNNNIKGCLSKLNEISKDVENTISNFRKETFTDELHLDKSGNSKGHFTIYKLDSGNKITLSCNNWDEKLRKKNNWSEGLSVALISKEINLWFSNRK